MQATTANDVQSSRPAAVRRRLREGRGVRNRVVDEHAERREADRASQVGREHECDHDSTESELGVVGDASPLRRSTASQRGRSPFRAIASVVRPTPAISASSAPRLATAAPARTTGCAQAAPTASHGRASGVELAASASGPGARPAQPRRRPDRARRRSRARSGSPAGSSAADRAPPRRALRSVRSRRMRRRAGRQTGAGRGRRRAASDPRPAKPSLDALPLNRIAPTIDDEGDDRSATRTRASAAVRVIPRRFAIGQHGDGRCGRARGGPTRSPERRTRRTSAPSRRTRRSCRSRTPSRRGSPTIRRAARGRRRTCRPRSGTAPRAAPTQPRCSTQRPRRARAR